MDFVIFYVLFSGFFTYGVTHAEHDDTLDVLIKLFLSLIFGSVMMPVFLGSWFDLNNKKK
jgi:hypothetical protein